MNELSNLKCRTSVSIAKLKAAAITIYWTLSSLWVTTYVQILRSNYTITGELMKSFSDTRLP